MSFNGATAFRRWKAVAGRIPARHVPASMGPPPFGDGKAAGLAPPIALMYASMGPPPFGDGKQPVPLSRRTRPTCFNGATAFRRWKARMPQGRSPSPSNRFNGATAFRRWKALFANRFRRILMLKCGFPHGRSIIPIAGAADIDSVPSCPSWEAASGPAFPLHHPASRRTACTCA